MPERRRIVAGRETLGASCRFGGDAGFVDAALPAAVLSRWWHSRRQDQCGRWDGDGRKEQASNGFGDVRVSREECAGDIA